MEGLGAFPSSPRRRFRPVRFSPRLYFSGVLFTIWEPGTGYMGAAQSNRSHTRAAHTRGESPKTRNTHARDTASCRPQLALLGRALDRVVCLRWSGTTKRLPAPEHREISTTRVDACCVARHIRPSDAVRPRIAYIGVRTCLVITCEPTKEGWSVRASGPLASGPLPVNVRKTCSPFACGDSTKAEPRRWTWSAPPAILPRGRTAGHCAARPSADVKRPRARAVIHRQYSPFSSCKHFIQLAHGPLVICLPVVEGVPGLVIAVSVFSLFFSCKHYIRLAQGNSQLSLKDSRVISKFSIYPVLVAEFWNAWLNAHVTAWP